MDKLKKIVYIVSGTLSILLMVFLLMHKVGLCASSGSSDSDSIVYLENWYPIPYGNRLGYASDFDIDDTFRSRILSATQFDSNNPVIITMYEEDLDEKLYFLCSQIKACYFNKESLTDTYSTVIANYEAVAGSVRYEVVYDIATDSFTSSTTSRFPTSRVSAFVSENPAYPTSGLPYLVQKGEYIFNYPIAVFVGGEISNIDTYGYTGNFSYPMDIPFFYKLVDNNSSSPEFGVFPSFDSLPNEITDSSNPDYNLYQWLNGQNQQNYNYTKSIFDLIKGFFSWVVAPPDSEVIQGAWDNTDIGGVVNYVSTLGNTLKSLLGNGAQVPESLSFNCSISLLGKTFPYTVDFSWYQDIKSQFLTVFLTFFYAGAFLYFIKSIPSFINGVSGSLNGFTQVKKGGSGQ